MIHAPARALAAALLVAVLLVTPQGASAQTYDHLECWKIKDHQAKLKYTADLTPEQTQFLAQTGCQIKVPAKEFCIDVEKSNVVPVPPNVLGGQNTRDFLCYTLKCPKQQFSIQVEDQFGTRQIDVKKPGRLCAPARKIGFPDPPTPTPCGPAATPTPGCVPVPETCNGQDDDCNMLVDDIPGLGSPCDGPDGDQCVEGTIACQGFTQVCTDTTGTTVETCNGADDNCNMQIDEMLGSTTCGTGQCQNTVQNCVGGMPQTCSPGPSSPEVCDNVDNNCNGFVDEGNLCPVPNGSQQCLAGSCGGVITCDAGYADCDANVITGCEVATASDPNNCGGCNLVCSGGTPNCVGGSCVP